MSIEAKHSSAWRSLSGIEAKHGGSWRDIQTVEVKHGGVWRTVFSSAPTVSLSSANVSWTSDFICYAIVRYGTDGVEWKNATSGTSSTTSSRGTWLTSGSASGAWVSRVINSGSLNWTDFGSSRYQMSSDRQLGVRDTNSGTANASANVTVSMHDASSGGNLLASATYSLIASYYNGCPLCCFTPDTPVMLASGIEMPIGRVRPDDELLFLDIKDNKLYSKKAGEHIVRYDRKMYAIQFEDGSVLRASDDHPLHVKDKGPAAINPLYEYKGLGVPDQLLVGDVVLGLDGKQHSVTAIREIDYKGAVFTFEDSFFFANGKLVY